MTNVIPSKGRINIRLYIRSHGIVSISSSVDSMPPAMKYGPIVHGMRNSVTKAPMKNAPFGEVMLVIIFLTLGLHLIGISVRRPPGLYQK